MSIIDPIPHWRERLSVNLFLVNISSRSFGRINVKRFGGWMMGAGRAGQRDEHNDFVSCQVGRAVCKSMLINYSRIVMCVWWLDDVVREERVASVHICISRIIIIKFDMCTDLCILLVIIYTDNKSGSMYTCVLCNPVLQKSTFSSFCNSSMRISCTSSGQRTSAFGYYNICDWVV